MSINAVQNNSNNNSHITGYIASAAVGSIGGYTLKWMLPVTKSEKDERYNLELASLKKEARQAKIKELQTIGKDFLKSVGVDEFLSRYDDDAAETAGKGISKKTSAPLPENISELFKRVNEAANIAKEERIKKLNYYTKSIRSTGAFVLIGAAVGLLTTFFHRLGSQTSRNY